MRGKRERGGICAGSFPRRSLTALPTVNISVGGRGVNALVDTGCSRTIVAPHLSEGSRGSKCDVVAVDGSRVRCLGESTVSAVVAGVPVRMNCIVAARLVEGVDVILGMDIINELGGMSVYNGRVEFGCERSEVSTGDFISYRKAQHSARKPISHASCVARTQAVAADHKDFEIEYDVDKKSWTASWRWIGGVQPDNLSNSTSEYSMPHDVKPKFEEEVERWIENGWLRSYDEAELGPPKALIPLMAVVQPNKDKVRPVMDFRELNSFVQAHTADADVCADKIRGWRREGNNVSTLDMSSAYMQVHVTKHLWPFQTVIFRDKRYCLTRLGFGLNVAPLIMKCVVAAALSRNEKVDKASSSYYDDIFVNEDIMSADGVRKHLEKHGLVCKPAERLADGARVLGLWVQNRGSEGSCRGQLSWSRSNEIPSPPESITRRSVFSFCGKLVGHLPVCGWLRPAVSFLKRRVNAMSQSWDDPINDSRIESMVAEILSRVRESDPSRGNWEVSGKEATVWVDASSLAFGAAIEVEGDIVEDASWLRSEGSTHINIAELDALIKGLNLAVCWGMKELHLKTDSLTVYHWISDALSGKARLKTRASSEMLIRRRVNTVKAVVSEYELNVDIALVPSHANLADVLTRVPQSWTKVFEDKSSHPPICVVACSMPPQRLRDIHEQTGHQGVERTLFFARRIDSTVPKSAVTDVIKACNTCNSIDPAPVHWKRGRLDVNETWKRLAMDFTHYKGSHYLTLTDCGPSRFTVWRQVRTQDSGSVVCVLEQLFFERGPPEEILTDNDTAFRSQVLADFLCNWSVRTRFRCAYVPSGNGIAERVHRTVKRIAARSNCSIAKATYWYNATPRDGCEAQTAPANGVHRYEFRILGVDAEVQPDDGCLRCPYEVGDVVFVKPSDVRCDVRYKTGVVTGVVSEHAVEVDGIPRHVRDLRSVWTQGDGGEARPSSSKFPGGELDEEDPEEHVTDREETVLRKSTRTILPPDRYGAKCWSHQ